jgi:hypothetical protein
VSYDPSGTDSWLEDAGEELGGVGEGDDVLRQIRDLLAMQVRGNASPEQQAWLQSTLGSRVGVPGTDPTEGEEGSQTSPYFSADVLADDAGEPDVINFGTMAETVVIHNVTDAVDVYFRDPGNDYSSITVEPGDSPFKFSGVYGAHTQKVWYAVNDGASVSETTFSVLAKFYPGSISPGTGAAGGN